MLSVFDVGRFTITGRKLWNRLRGAKPVNGEMLVPQTTNELTGGEEVMDAEPVPQ